MAYIWFQNVLEALGKRLNYESISNIYGNSFAKDAAKLVQAANPLIKESKTGNSAQTFMQMPGQLTIIKKDDSNKQMKDFFGDMDWIMKK